MNEERERMRKGRGEGERERKKKSTYLKAKPVLLLPEAEMGDLLIPEFIWLHHTH